MSDFSKYLPLWSFVVLMVGTPGPANLLLMSAGATHKLDKLVRFGAGLIFGKLLLNIGIAFGFTSLLANYPNSGKIVAIISAAYMIFPALRGWNKISSDDKEDSFFGFFSGSIVHPLNPKAWVMVTLAYSQFASEYQTVFELYFLVPLSFLFAQLIFHSLWCLAGFLLQKQMKNNLALNRGLIILTICVVAWALIQ